MARIRFVMAILFLSCTLDLHVTTLLRVVRDESARHGWRVTEHVDMWDVGSLLRSVPLFGRLYSSFLPLLGAASSLAVRVLCPTPRSLRR